MKVAGVKVGHLKNRDPWNGVYGEPRGWARINAVEIEAVVWYMWRYVDGQAYGASLSFTYDELDRSKRARANVAWSLREIRALFKIRLRRLEAEHEQSRRAVS